MNWRNWLVVHAKAAGYGLATLVVTLVPATIALVAAYGDDLPSAFTGRAATLGFTALLALAALFAAGFLYVNEVRSQQSGARQLRDWERAFSEILFGRVALASLYAGDTFLDKASGSVTSELHRRPEERQIRVSLYRCDGEYAVLVYSNEDPGGNESIRRLKRFEGLPGTVLAGLDASGDRWGKKPSRTNTVVFRWGAPVDDTYVLAPVLREDGTSVAPSFIAQRNAFVAATSFKYRSFRGIVVLTSKVLPPALKDGPSAVSMDDALVRDSARTWLARCSREMRLLAQGARQTMRLAQSAQNGSPDRTNLHENYREDVVASIGPLSFDQIGRESSPERGPASPGTHTLMVQLVGAKYATPRQPNVVVAGAPPPPTR